MNKETSTAKHINHIPEEKTIFEGISMHYRGNPDSRVTLWYISDYNCDACINFEPLYYLLYDKYKSSVRFGNFNLSLSEPLKGIAAECAAKQGRYWEMDELLYFPAFVDTAILVSKANEIGLDIGQFLTDLRDKPVAEEYDSAKRQIMKAGILSTPTIIVNSRIFENPENINEIQKYIDQLL